MVSPPLVGAQPLPPPASTPLLVLYGVLLLIVVVQVTGMTSLGEGIATVAITAGVQARRQGEPGVAHYFCRSDGTCSGPSWSW